MIADRRSESEQQASDKLAASAPSRPPLPARCRAACQLHASGGLDLHEVRRLWPSVLDRVKGYRRVTWAQLFEKSEV